MLIAQENSASTTATAGGDTISGMISSVPRAHLSTGRRLSEAKLYVRGTSSMSILNKNSTTSRFSGKNNTDAVNNGGGVRVVKIKGNGFNIDLPVYSNAEWRCAESALNSFHGMLLGDDVQMHSKIELLGAFLGHVTSILSQGDHTNSEDVKFLQSVFTHFHLTYLSGNHIHAATLDLPIDARKKLNRIYYTARCLLSDADFDIDYECPVPTSALLDAAVQNDTQLFALFGGQGHGDYLDELGDTYNTYEQSRGFIKKMGEHLVDLAESADARRIGFHPDGMDVVRWIMEPSSRPNTSYLVSAPVSCPLIALTQLAHYWVMLSVLGMEPSEVISRLSGASGHSQGIVAAAVISSSLNVTEFVNNTIKALSLLFWLGTRSQQAYPPTTMNPAVLQDSLDHDEGVPTPMLAIRNISLSVVTDHIKATNQHLRPDRQLEVALVNGPRSVVVSGHPQSLHGLNSALRKLKSKGDLSENRLPYSRRKPHVITRYLPVSVPFHSTYLTSVLDVLIEDVKRFGLEWSSMLSVPVISTTDGSDMRSITDDKVTEAMIRMITVESVTWERATSTPGITHMLDFGPGGPSGCGALTHTIKEGTGIQVVLAGTLATTNHELLDQGSLFNSDCAAVRFAPNWELQHAPQLVRLNDKIFVDTKFTRLIGKPPLMVAGMTPTTVNEDFVAAVLNAGFHCELAGGGQYSETMLRGRVDRLLSKVDAGEGVTLNMLFLNQRQWAFQFPLVQRMREEGIPVDGVCVAAGVPSPDKANEIIEAMVKSGIRHVSFKPGSVESIRRTVAIAKANPIMPILLQWTGGRAGGHHSFEDFHQPLLETYGIIRKQPNIVLIAGSGMGDAKGSLPYLSGAWSTRLQYPPMPFDGVLFGSRVMVAAECKTSEMAKHRLVATPGIEDESQWEKSYDGPIGGIVTVTSELGEPIHKVATRGVMLWKELDEKMFSLPKDKLLPALKENKNWIVARLNSDYQKVYFGKKTSGEVCDLPEMTYAEVISRLVELMWVAHQRRWIHPSYERVILDFMLRTEERLMSEESMSDTSFFTSNALLDDDGSPMNIIGRFLETYPTAFTQLITSEDVRFFLSLCKRRGQKPIPFVPILDEDFKLYFKKDSLWQSEDLDAVVGQDVERVCILQGPVAVRYSTKANVPVKDILDDIHDEYVQTILQSQYNGDVSQVPLVEHLTSFTENYSSHDGVNHLHKAALGKSPVGVTVAFAQDMTQCVFSDDASIITPVKAWLDFLTGTEPTWLRALLTTPYVVQNRSIVPNRISKVFRPRNNQTVRLDRDAKSGHVTRLKIFDPLMSARSRRNMPLAAVDVYNDDHGIIHVILNEVKDNSSASTVDIVALTLRFRYRPDQSWAPIHEIMETRNLAIKDFYSRLWFNEPLPVADNIEDTFSCEHVISRAEITEFCRVVGNQSDHYVEQSSSTTMTAPMDFAIVAGWRAITRGIFPKVIDGDILRLVHLSNSFRVLGSSKPLQERDCIITKAKVISVENMSAGKHVQIRGVLWRRLSCGKEEEVMEVLSTFLYRGVFNHDFSTTFRHEKPTETIVRLESPKEVAVLRGKSWIKWDDAVADVLVNPETTVTFRYRSSYRFRAANEFSYISVTGAVFAETDTKEIVQIGIIRFESSEANGNPVADYVSRFGKPIEKRVLFENGGYSVLPPSDAFSTAAKAPATNSAYSIASGDLNPIHTNLIISDYAGLPGTITHGMWTSASSRRFVEVFAAGNDPERVVAYEARFINMVLPGDSLETQLWHVGMVSGRKIIRVETTNQRGEKVLEGMAEVKQPVSAYVFTGQGSQEKGMGMDLYDSSPVAREIWDYADSHFLERYGFSILEIVRTNPKEKTVHFGGAKGKRIRKNYMAMTYEMPQKDGTTCSVSLFPDLNESTQFHTFRSPNGLLSATQFTQPALVLFERAAFADMRAKGLVEDSCIFAGHSLGEYAALASIANVMPLESLVDVVFYRGMTMQCAVPRDSLGRSNYGMIAVNPSRVGRGFSEVALQYLCDAISQKNEALLEIVNFNVENWQYVVAGDLLCLDILCQVLNYVYKEKIDLAALLKSLSIDRVQEQLEHIVIGARDVSIRKRSENGGILTLERCIAAIPLHGIDVPFHSRFLLSGVGPFRQYLSKCMSVSNINIASLRGRYIPNLTARPFDISREYVQYTYDVTSSPRLKAVLKEWDVSGNSHYADDVIPKYSTGEEQQWLAYTLIVELLCYQFASPVRWIETQDILLGEFGVERLVEIGPSPLLANMAARTLKLKYLARDEATNQERQLLCLGRDRGAIMYEFSSNESSATSAVATAPVVTVVPQQVAIPTAKPIVNAHDAPVSAEEILYIIVASKLNQPISSLALDKSIKDLVGGKSTLQNELLGDLGVEFGTSSVGEGAAEVPLRELAATITASGHAGKLGKLTSAAIAKLVGGKMPGGLGLSKVKAHLSSSYGFGPGRLEGALLHALTMEPSARFSSEEEAFKWWDTVIDSYVKRSGISLQRDSGPINEVAIGTTMVSSVSATTVAIPDTPVTALEFLRILISVKLKQPPSAVSSDKSIKSLVGGKSTLQNELIGDISTEFGVSASESAAEMSLVDLAAEICSGYITLGKVSSSMTSRLVGSKMPGGFGMSRVKSHLSSKGLGSGRTDAVLLHSLSMEPSSRFGNDDEALTWWNSVIESYAQTAGISLNASSNGGDGNQSLVTSNVSSEALRSITARHDSLYRAQLQLLASHLGIDLRSGSHALDSQNAIISALQSNVDALVDEHGERYISGLQPMFDARKMREYDSYWNWVVQDLQQLYYDILQGRLTSIDRVITEKCLHVMNRADEHVINIIDYHVEEARKSNTPSSQLMAHFGSMLASNCRSELSFPPLYRDVMYHTAPKVVVTPEGQIKYYEVARPNVRSLEDYVCEMNRGVDLVSVSDGRGGVADPVREATAKRQRNKLVRVMRKANLDMAMRTTLVTALRNSRRLLQYRVPLLHLKRKVTSGWEYNKKLTKVYLNVLHDIASNGVTFEHKTALMTGCGRGSIGVEVAKALLAGGATVIVTTSSYRSETTEFYKKLYCSCSGKRGRLVVLPFNQGSSRDINNLIEYIYNRTSGLGLDLDFIVPFAAISENGAELGEYSSKNELAHRIMLTNLLRLLGVVKNYKAAAGIDTRPALVVLPLSPNHGIFGGDGLYAESKIGLETLFFKWKSESWSPYLTIAGAIIGWTRGTGLMSDADIVAEGVEKLGVRTFSQREMAFNLVGLMHQSMVDLSQREPVYADLNGGMNAIEDLNMITSQIRSNLQETSAIRRALVKDAKVEQLIMKPENVKRRTVSRRANLLFEFPELKSREQLESEVPHHADLTELLDLDRVIVVTGFGEVGPWGNSRTRWEMEANGAFSLEGCIEMSWIMGFIRHYEGRLPSGEQYAGWVDSATGSPVQDTEVKKRYESAILEHSGIRVVEPELFGGYDPNRKQFYQQVAITHDMHPVECTADEASAFKLEHGDLVDVFEDDGAHYVAMKKGASLYIPKALRFDRFVAGQIPTGWDPVRYGVPKDIVDQVDPVTLYNIVSTVEAMISAGITDPYEFYEYVHVSELGNTTGGGMGGLRAIIRIFRDRKLDKPVQGDILQENFINTMPAWVNMLLLSSSGPIKTPVGACATAVESVEIGVDTLLSGKAKVVVVGGYDDFQEDSSYEFASMQATSNAEAETSMGRSAREMSRPATTTRGGFMESHGAGNQVLMSANLAVRMGVPIYGIVALTNTATDKEGRSVPAPGQGILTTAREAGSKFPSLMMNLKWRAKQCRRAKADTEAWRIRELNALKVEAEALVKNAAADIVNECEGDVHAMQAFLEERRQLINEQADRQISMAKTTWGNEFFVGNKTVAPLRGALAVYGLTIDDLCVASFHGTGTKANDKNESSVVNQQMEHLGRSLGNPLHSIFQKYLTGHPKGAAAAWMFNGILQTLNSGIIPGNRNADNVAIELKDFKHIHFPSKSLHTQVTLKAGLLKSFGFGQVGGEVLIIHSDFVFASLDSEVYAQYALKRAERERRTYRYMHDSLVDEHAFVQVKHEAPYTEDLQRRVYLDPSARASYDSKAHSWTFRQSLVTSPGHVDKNTEASKLSANLHVALTAMASNNIDDNTKTSVPGIGVDVEEVAAINIHNEVFLSRNYTSTEINYCRSQPDTRASFTGRWCAKEAIVKAISSRQLHEDKSTGTSLWRGPGAGLKDIELLPTGEGPPRVVLHGETIDVAKRAGVDVYDIRVSISHSGAYALAIANAN